MSIRRRSVRVAAYMFVSGAGVGMMTGLSFSPVVATVLASVIAVVVSVASVLSGLEITPAEGESESDGSHRRNRVRLDPLPVAALVVGLTAGAMGGTVLRTRNVLGTGAPSEQTRLGVLFRNEVAVCGDLRATPDDALADALRQTVKQQAHMLTIVNECGGTKCLRAVVEVLCANQ